MHVAKLSFIGSPFNHLLIILNNRYIAFILIDFFLLLCSTFRFLKYKLQCKYNVLLLLLLCVCSVGE